MHNANIYKEVYLVTVSSMVPKEVAATELLFQKAKHPTPWQQEKAAT